MPAKHCLCLILVLFMSLYARADSNPDTDLKTIMQALRNDAANVLDGLLIDDYEAIASAAARIADHPKIPSEQVTLVAAELGAEMAAFKQMDTRVHDLSLAIQSAALEKDRGRIIAGYQQMITACLACHASYRQRVAMVLDSTGESE